jgi:hypothetical protein
MVGKKKFLPSSFGAVVGSGMDKRDPGSGINIPDSQHCCRFPLFVKSFSTGSIVDPVYWLNKSTTALGFYKQKRKQIFHTKTTC